MEQTEKREPSITIPNAVTSLRIFFAFGFAWLVFSNVNHFVLFSIFMLAAITDFFDGYIARKLNQVSHFGAVLDQYIDRAFTILIVGSLILYESSSRTPYSDFIGTNLINLLFLSSSREILTIPAIVIILFRKKELYHVEYIGKITTAVQSLTVGCIILGIPQSFYPAIITFFFGMASAINYTRYAFSK